MLLQIVKCWSKQTVIVYVLGLIKNYWIIEPNPNKMLLLLNTYFMVELNS